MFAWIWESFVFMWFHSQCVRQEKPNRVSGNTWPEWAAVYQIIGSCHTPFSGHYVKGSPFNISCQSRRPRLRMPVRGALYARFDYASNQPDIESRRKQNHPRRQNHKQQTTSPLCLCILHI